MSKDAGRERPQRRRADDAVVARWDHEGSRFEVLVDPAAVQEIRDGKTVDLRDRLSSEHIYKDAVRGDKISEEFLQKIFQTSDYLEVAKLIIQKGEVQITTDQRHQLQAVKRKQIVATIARNAMNPQTGAPHPPARIEAAMEEAKVHVDPFRSADAQVQEVLTKLRPLLPIRFDTVKMKLRVPGQHYPRVIGELKGMGKLSEEAWGSDGSWTALLEIPAGLQTELLEKLNARTKGAAEAARVK
jgi:ribosome maturation protein SDO1